MIEKIRNDYIETLRKRDPFLINVLIGFHKSQGNYGESIKNVHVGQ